MSFQATKGSSTVNQQQISLEKMSELLLSHCIVLISFGQLYQYGS
ncbi:Uncharacterized protein APZ42_025069 [Daphnia magna]|uniref:Uncharacterized protein n=1 Tax=Daphnia magna TaxID=35525 RepID=A0A162DDZ5_9CRUS|nr:Uncharacterized protein APZ42_025069 [Daphnia magna]